MNSSRKAETAVSPPSSAFDLKGHITATIVADLQKRGESRPKKRAALRNTMAAVLQKKLSEDQLSALFDHLVAVGYIFVNESSVTYSLPPMDA